MGARSATAQMKHARSANTHPVCCHINLVAVRFGAAFHSTLDHRAGPPHCRRQMRYIFSQQVSFTQAAHRPSTLEQRRRGSGRHDGRRRPGQQKQTHRRQPHTPRRSAHFAPAPAQTNHWTTCSKRSRAALETEADSAHRAEYPGVSESYFRHAQSASQSWTNGAAQATRAISCGDATWTHARIFTKPALGLGCFDCRLADFRPRRSTAPQSRIRPVSTRSTR
jgi:hypothetical protein